MKKRLLLPGTRSLSITHAPLLTRTMGALALLVTQLAAYGSQPRSAPAPGTT